MIKKQKFSCTCIQCGNAFEALSQAATCSPSCKAIRNAIVRGRQIATVERQCEVCGKAFTRQKRKEDAARCCSRECGWELQRQHLKATGKARDKFKRLIASLASCHECKGIYVRATSLQVLCGSKCRNAKAAREAMEDYYRKHPAKPCVGCGGDVQPTYGAKGRITRPQHCRTCSKELWRISKKKQRKKDKKQRSGVTASTAKGILLGLKAMIDKAKGQCPSCGLAMSKAVDPTHDRAMEIDHIMPISKGGTDTMDNLRPICRKCNALKSDFIPIKELLKSSAGDTAPGHWHISTDHARRTVLASAFANSGVSEVVYG